MAERGCPLAGVGWRVRVRYKSTLHMFWSTLISEFKGGFIGRFAVIMRSILKSVEVF